MRPPCDILTLASQHLDSTVLLENDFKELKVNKYICSFKSVPYRTVRTFETVNFMSY